MFVSSLLCSVFASVFVLFLRADIATFIRRVLSSRVDYSGALTFRKRLGNLVREHERNMFGTF